MADPSNSSNIRHMRNYLRSIGENVIGQMKDCFYPVTVKPKKGLIKIKEWKPPSTIELLKEVQSSGTLSDALFEIVRHLIDQCWGNGPAHIAKWTDCKGQGIKM